MITLDHVTHLFGSRTSQALAAARQCAGRARILDRLDTTLALDDVSLDIAPGEVFVVMGLSGSGKSTLVRLINGLIQPQAGRVIVDGEDVTAMRPRDLVRFRRNRIAMVFQSFALFPHKTVGENAAFGLAVEGMGKAEREVRARHWLDRVGLDAYVDAYPQELSGGMRQRVGLARALCVDAAILLMDEPFSALDPVTRSDLQALTLELEAELQRTIVFVTHDFAEAERLATRMAVLHDGRVAQTGTPQEIRTAPADAQVSAFVASAVTRQDGGTTKA